MKNLLRLLGSLSFAISLIASLAVILIASTLLESAYGTPFIQKFFYQAGWFNVFLALVGVNIFCSTLNRWPFQKHHTGFVITHIGILMLLTGSLLSRLSGIDGQMALGEGESQDQILVRGYELALHTPDHQTHTFDLKPYTGKEKRELRGLGHSLKLYIHQVAEDVAESPQISGGGSQDPLNHAIRFTLDSALAGVHDSVWLVEKNPLDPTSDSVTMDPAHIELKPKEPPAPADMTAAPDAPSVRILQKSTGKVSWIDLSKIPANDTPLGDTGLRVSGVRYLPDARVTEKMELVSSSDEPRNPAVEFTVQDSQGQKEFHTKFALFPEFESLHGKIKKDLFGLAIELKIPGMTAEDTPKPKAGLVFHPPAPIGSSASQANGWTYTSSSSHGTTQGILEAGKTYKTGWMDFAFQVDELLDHAVVSRKVVKSQNMQKGQVGVELSLEKDGKVLAQDWVFPDKPFRLDTEKGPFLIAVAAKTAGLPFALALKDFRKIDYPGTSDPSSFESDVALEDPAEHVTIQKTIRMNKPLDYKGYRVFQSSYSQDPSFGETSIFTVAKNPGITLIYTGAIVLFTGTAFVFYVNPFSSLRRRTGSGKKR